MRSVGLKRARRGLLEGFSLSLPDPGLYALEGPVGSGKSLLGRLLCGLLRPSSGRIAVDGQDVNRLLPLRRPALWYCDVRQEIAGGQTVEDYLRTLVYDSGGNQQDAVALLERLAAAVGLPRGLPLEEASSGQLAALQCAAAGIMPLRLIVLDGHPALLDERAGADCIDLLAAGLAGRESCVLLLSTRFPAALPGLRQSWRLAGGLPIRLAEDGPADGLGEDAAATALRVRLQGGRRLGQAYQSGQYYKVLGLLEDGLRIEVHGHLTAALEEMQANGLHMRCIEWE